MGRIQEILERNPIIPAIKDEKGLAEVLESESELVFILTSNLFNIKSMVKRLKEREKIVFVHADLVDGLSHSTYALEYLIKNTELDGIISTKHSIIKNAKKMEVMVIQRFFLLDSLSLENTLKYTHLIDIGEDSYVARVAVTTKDIVDLVDRGFEYVCEHNSTKIFRKHK